MKISSEMYSMYVWTSKNALNSGSHPPLDTDSGRVWRILQHCNKAHFFHSLARISGKIVGCSRKYIAVSTLDLVEVIWIRTPDLDWIRVVGGLRSPSALVSHICTSYYFSINMNTQWPLCHVATLTFLFVYVCIHVCRITGLVVFILRIAINAIHLALW